MAIRSFICLFIFLSCVLPIQASAEKSIFIAVNIATSGIHYESDQGILDGAQLAVDVINQQGGVLGQPLELFVTDNQSSMIGAKVAAKQAIDKGVSAVIGAGRSSQSLIIAPLFQEAGILMVSPYSTSPKITQIGDYIFRACFTDEFQGNMLANFASKVLKKKKAVVLVNISEGYSQVLAKFFTDTYEKNGGEIIFQGNYKNYSMDFTALIDKIKSLQPELIFLPGYSKRSAWIIKQARKNGIQGLFLGGDGMGLSMYQFGGSAIENTYSADHWHFSMLSNENKDFLEQYQKKFNGLLLESTGVALAYDSIMLIAQAIERSQKTDSESIRNALKNTKDFQGVTGKFSFNEFGDPNHKQLIMTVFEHGKKQYFESYLHNN